MTLPLSRPRAVLFDWDGTLVDSGACVEAAHNHVRRAFGMNDFTPEEFMHAARIGTGRETFTVLYPTRVNEALDLYYGVVPALRATHVGPIPGALDFIEYLYRAGIPLGVVSNMRHDPLVEEIARMNWSHYFQTVIGAGEAARGKPSPEPVYLAAERMGMTRADLENVWFVGDMETDEKAAKSARCPFLYYTGGISDARERSRMQASVKFDDYRKILHDVAPFLVM